MNIPKSSHLQVHTTERGFKHLDSIVGSYGGHVRVYESSNAEHAHIWLNASAPKNLNRPEGEKVEAPIHLTVEDARKLAEQLLLLVDGHYQVEPLRPDQMRDGKSYRVYFEGIYKLPAWKDEGIFETAETVLSDDHVEAATRIEEIR